MPSSWETTSLSIQTLELLLRLALHSGFIPIPKTSATNNRINSKRGRPPRDDEKATTW